LIEIKNMVKDIPTMRTIVNKKIKMKKNRILLLSFFLVAIVAIGNTSNKGTDLQTPSTAEQVYERLEVSSRLPRFANRYIDRVSRNRPEVPASLWQTIKSSMDYSGFKSLAINVLNDYFTNSELQNLITDNEKNPYIPILHLGLRNELQLALENFSSNLTTQVNNLLTSNGYQSL